MRICADWNERRIEDYVRRLLTESEVDKFEDHLVFCQSCQGRVQEEWDFAEAARAALRQLSDRPRSGTPYGNAVMSGARNAGWSGV